ncbi:hypothetical protein SIID45300_03178 [Candidatus Magnetaquicoccaceae bacterium FCR-1]|uniref:Prokaryotic metallothionein n=1 Tax=Candidatus Magnetaquiglobus chichijimensis TaxID=3141448 RepID=A0ABQ0CD62_9PROT
MLLLRFLLAIAAGYLIYRLVRRFIAPANDTLNAPPAGSGSKLVRCERCATLIPPENALVRGDHLFCSEQCRTAS